MANPSEYKTKDSYDGARLGVSSEDDSLMGYNIDAFSDTQCLLSEDQINAALAGKPIDPINLEDRLEA